MAVGIQVEHSVAYIHTQNGLAESLIKRLLIIVRSMLLMTTTPTSAWGHAILHDVVLIHIGPTACNSYSPQQLIVGKEHDISHIKTFGCAIYMPIAPSNRTKISP